MASGISAISPHQYFYYYGRNNLAGVRDKEWKLAIRKGKSQALYRLAEDPGEKKNLLARYPQVAAQLLQQALKFDRQVKRNVRKAAFVDNPEPLRLKNP